MSIEGNVKSNWIIVPKLNVWHKIVHKRSSWKKGKLYWHLSKKIENWIPNLWKFIYSPICWVIITNIEQKTKLETAHLIFINK
jgi:hypothetical protein